MRIGIDIDDVITDTSEMIVEFIEKDSNSQKLKKHIKSIMKGDPTEPEVVSFCLKNYIRVFQKVKAKNNASRVIQNLLDRGNEIFLITARGDTLGFFRGSEEITKRFLEKNNIKFTKIIFNATDKARICADNQIALMVDDSIEYCEDVEKMGIKSIVFTSSVNRGTFTTVERVNDWLELEEKILELGGLCCKH